MTSFLFVGPTLRPNELPEVPGLVALPPVAQGDLYRAAQRHPQAIGIIDGYFDGVPSVWHKEILWAMAEGIHVFGSASMGALRAAELHPFGMRGVGRIFDAYCAGVLVPYHEPFEDDDEVAVIHGPAETGYVALSEAMVNIRVTLARAEAAGVIGRPTMEALSGLGKGLFYHDRSYERLLALAAEAPLPASELAALRAWLPHGRVDQKRLDAEAMLAAMATCEAAPMRVDYRLEWTEMWEDAIVAASGPATDPGAGTAGWLPAARILDELRLDADAWLPARDRALLRLLTRREAHRRHQPVDPHLQRVALDRLRVRHGLFRRADLDRWLEANDLDAARLDRLAADGAHVQGMASAAASALDERLLDDLVMEGAYVGLAERARAKQALLASLGLDHPRPQDVGITPATLLAWYFERRLRRPLPDNVDDAAHDQGFQDRSDFYRALLGEWLYCRAME